MLVLECVVADAEAPRWAESSVAVEDRASPLRVAQVNSLMAQVETWVSSEALVFPKKLGKPDRAETELLWQPLTTDRDSWSWQRP